MTAVIGLDLSSTSTGICLPDGTTDHITARGDLYPRAAQIVGELRDWLAPRHDLVVIEAIGTRHINTAISLAYVHCLTDRLLQDDRVLKVAPTVLKKFATNNGNADKTAMTTAAMRNGWEPGDGVTDDEADAWWLRALGMHVLGEPVVESTRYRATVLAGLDGPAIGGDT